MGVIGTNAACEQQPSTARRLARLAAVRLVLAIDYASASSALVTVVHVRHRSTLPRVACRPARPHASSDWTRWCQRTALAMRRSAPCSTAQRPRAARTISRSCLVREAQPDRASALVTILAVSIVRTIRASSSSRFVTNTSSPPNPRRITARPALALSGAGERSLDSTTLP